MYNIPELSIAEQFIKQYYVQSYPATSDRGSQYIHWLDQYYIRKPQALIVGLRSDSLTAFHNPCTLNNINTYIEQYIANYNMLYIPFHAIQHPTNYPEYFI